MATAVAVTVVRVAMATAVASAAAPATAAVADKQLTYNMKRGCPAMGHPLLLYTNFEKNHCVPSTLTFVSFITSKMQVTAEGL